MRNIIRRATYSVLCAVEHKTDAATGEHGDLLDIIRERLALDDFRDVANEARRFLNLPRSTSAPPSKPARPAVRRGSREAARRLFAISRPIEGTLTEHYLQRRGIAHVHHGDSLRHQARCYYFGPDDEEPPEIWPAMIACVTNVDGIITGGHRTWLDPEGFGPNRLGKAPIETPRRAMGDLLGNAVRFGVANDVLVAGEGLETMLSLRCVLPTMPMAATLSASHLAALLMPPTLRRLYIACDSDAAGMGAAAALMSRAHEAGIEAIVLSPGLGDFNEDLRALGLEELRAAVCKQLTPQDVARFLT
jgi:hypothetical protein